MELNPSQLQAILHKDGPMLVCAGPGSGKTAVIIHRVNRLITQEGISPDQVLVVTFTKAAAQEMEHRFLSLSGSCAPLFGTFHSVFFRMLRTCPGFGSLRIISEKEKRQLLQTELYRENTGREDPELLLSMIMNDISRLKNSGSTSGQFHPESMEQEPFQRMFRNYQAGLSQMGVMDFDDILLQTANRLRSDSRFLSFWQNHFRYFLVDEFQDVNTLQYEALRLLAGKQSNLFVVGDDDQSIYRFRGSDPLLMQRFLQEYPSCKQVTLDRNYRCPPRILSPSLALIRHNPDRIFKDLVSMAAGSNTCFSLSVYPDQITQYRQILKEIQKEREDGVSFREMALLVRSNRDLDLLGKLFADQQIPVRMQNSALPLNEHFIAKDVSSYLKCAAGEGTLEDSLRILNRPSRFLSRNALMMDNARKGIRPEKENWLWKLTDVYAGNEQALRSIEMLRRDLSFLSQLSPYAAIQYLRKSIGYETYLKEYASFRQRSWETEQAVLEKLQEYAKGFSDDRTFLKALHTSFPAEPDPKEPAQPEEAVRVLTMHASKGLEFQTVFLPDLNKGILPASRCREEADIQEERRLLYVAMTRASKNLFLSYSESIRGKTACPSFFLSELSGL